jgi:hypothetical protein
VAEDEKRRLISPVDVVEDPEPVLRRLRMTDEHGVRIAAERPKRLEDSAALPR